MPSSLRKVIVVFKTHFDLGFTDLPDRVMQLYTGRMFSAVREVMDATANEPEGLRYSWTLPAWPLRFLLHDLSVSEETRQAARKLVEEGRLNWHAWPFTTHTAFCGLEDLVRGLHISRSLSEEFGRWPAGAKQTDVPGHTWILPSMLQRAGVKFLHLGCNSGSRAPHVPRLFWWEGPDGSRLLTYYSAGGYGTPLLPPDDWPYDTWLAVQQTVDNVGPQSPEDLKRIRRTVAKGAPGVDLVFGELGDFAESLLEHPEQLAGLPVVPYDLADTWIHGIGTMPREVARARELRASLLALEEAVAAHEWPGREGVENFDFPLARRIASLIDAAYEQLLLFGEHTWGLDVKSTIKRVYGGDFRAARESEAYKRLETSWAIKGDYVTRAEALYQQAWVTANEVVQQNDLPHNQSSGQKLEVMEGSLGEGVLEDERLRLEVDPSSGGIISLTDKYTGREWVDKSSGEPFGGYRYDLYSIGDIAEFMRSYGTFFQDWFVQDFGKQGYPEDSKHITAYARDFSLSKSEDGSIIYMTGGKLRSLGDSGVKLPDQTISMKIWLSPFAGSVDIDYMVERKEATPMAESAVVPFPLNLLKPQFRLGQVGSAINPARDLYAGANHSLWCADWIDASDERAGLAVVTVNMPLVSIGNIGIYCFEPERASYEPSIYAHLLNTQWGTNFPQWLDGDFHWRVRLLPHPNDWRGAEIWHAAEEYNHDITRGVLRTKMNSGTLPLGIPHGLALQSVRPRHDGPGLIVRLSDVKGSYGRETLDIEGPVKAVWRCDLMERPIEEMKLIKGENTGDKSHVELPVAPHAIETLLIEFDGSR